jgi:superfamily I DNA and/or RNA helicase
MAEIKDILQQYPDDIITNKLKGKVISSEIDSWKNEPSILAFEKQEVNHILFSLNNKRLRIEFERHVSIKNTESTAFFQTIFWISDYNKHESTIEIQFLKCGNGQIFKSTLDIGFGDDIINSERFKKAKLDKIPEYLSNDYIFKANGSVFLFIETFPNSDNNFRIYGSQKRADIFVENSKWILKKESNKPFPKKYDDFLPLSVAWYDDVQFVESSKAKEAYETIQAEEAKGNTLIKLWESYSAIEIERATKLKDKIGILNFKQIKNTSNGITRVTLDNLTEEQKIAFKENKDDILSSSLELTKLEDANSTSNRFNIKAINDDSVELYDDLNLLPNLGSLELSTIGNEIVQKRRTRAIKSLREDRKLITKNLRFAIEGMCDAMFEKPRHEKPLTNRTRKFLREKFDIDDLTPNQKDAVEIAINTPDIAIIQGPPGTGKSTVVAAICDRLIEIAERAKKSTDKLILVSAFQNDTVEHIASKIHTFGLPTIKIGKETQGMSAEEIFIQEMQNKIDDALQHLAANNNTTRISKKLTDIKTLYATENNKESIKKQLNNIVNDVELNSDLALRWKEIFADIKLNTDTKDKNITALKGIRTDVTSYNDDGFKKILRILKTDIPFTKEEKALLDDESPEDNPPEDFLQKLSVIKDKYLQKYYSVENQITESSDIGLKEWIDDAIIYFKTKEETAYEDEDTFYTAILESLREDLFGNTDYIRDSIKSYSKSLAATNQVAGGWEMSTYNTVENVVLEEAARSNPLDLIIPMSKATERIIMVGDQNQLPHLLEDDIADEVVTTTLAETNQTGIGTAVRKKLEESLFSVIFKNLEKAKPVRRIILTEQFRMHPVIGDFISKVYYNGELKAGMSNQADKKQHNLSLDWAKGKVAVFCDVPQSQGNERSDKSKSRPAEAVRIVKLLDELKNDPNFENLSIGIITFYAKQVDVIFEEIQKKGYVGKNADGGYEISREYKKTKDGREKLRIGSVDSFQGKEFDIVILSTVRSNKVARTHENHKKIFGFLTLSNRLNVAFSRSQKLVIVVGNASMFADDFAKTYVEGLHEFYVQLSNDKEYGNKIR